MFLQVFDGVLICSLFEEAGVLIGNPFGFAEAGVLIGSLFAEAGVLIGSLFLEAGVLIGI